MTEFFKRRTALVKRTIDGFRNEDGGITVLNVFLVVVIALLGGVAIDMANLITARTQLQIAADVAAHAAIYTRDSEDKDDAKAKAVELALQNQWAHFFVRPGAGSLARVRQIQKVSSTARIGAGARNSISGQASHFS